MRRRDFIKLVGISGTTIALDAYGKSDLSQTRKSVRKKPNIIFVLSDDLGYGDLGCYGQDKIKTPNLDRMAAEGMRFTDHYSGSAVCAPARCALMTGKHTGHATIRENSLEPLDAKDITIPQLLKKAGYTTGLVGKWGLGEYGSISVPTKVGFDYFYGFLNQGVAHFHYAPWVWKNETKIMIPENADGKRGIYIHDLFTDEACKFIERNRQSPFFLYLAYTLPHAEMAVPEDSLSQYKGNFPERPKKEGGGGGGYGTGLPGYCGQETPNACYAGMISRMDRDMGRIFKRLKELAIDEDTIVIFTSDNGPSGEGGNDIKYFNSRGPLRDQKGSLYDGGIRVPMIARFPGTIKAGSTSKHISAFWDFMPTFMELAGIADVAQTDGISMAATLLGHSEQQKAHLYLYWELGRQNAQAVRMGPWKGLYFITEDRLELYDLERDPEEKQNIAADHSVIVKKIRQIMQEAHSPSRLFPLPSDKETLS
jgi:arylsulfatase A